MAAKKQQQQPIDPAPRLPTPDGPATGVFGQYVGAPTRKWTSVGDADARRFVQTVPKTQLEKNTPPEEQLIKALRSWTKSSGRAGSKLEDALGPALAAVQQGEYTNLLKPPGGMLVYRGLHIRAIPKTVWIEGTSRDPVVKALKQLGITTPVVAKVVRTKLSKDVHLNPPHNRTLHSWTSDVETAKLFSMGFWSKHADSIGTLHSWMIAIASVNEPNKFILNPVNNALADLASWYGSPEYETIAIGPVKLEGILYFVAPEYKNKTGDAMHDWSARVERYGNDPEAVKAAIPSTTQIFHALQNPDLDDITGF